MREPIARLASKWETGMSEKSAVPPRISATSVCNRSSAIMRKQIKPDSVGLSAPPVYRPNNHASVATPKASNTLFQNAAGINAKTSSSPAPSVYRPIPSGYAGPPVYRPTSNVVERMRVSSGAPQVYRPISSGCAAPPVYRPTSSVVERMSVPSGAPPVYHPQASPSSAPQVYRPAENPVQKKAKSPSSSKQQSSPPIQLHPNRGSHPTRVTNIVPAAMALGVKPFVPGTIQRTGAGTIQPFVRLAGESPSEYTVAQKAIAKKLGEQALISDDYQIACHGKYAYLHDSVVRAAKLGEKILGDTISWKDGSSTVTLYRYRVAPPSTDDCGKVAREVLAKIHGISPKSGFITSDPAAESALNPRKVGVQRDLKTYRRDQFAKPDIGEAYVSIPLPNSGYKEKINFHWGAVLAKSGGDVLTLEGFAGTGVDNWSFELSSQTRISSEDFQSFHAIWSILFDAHTFVVKPQGTGAAPVTTGNPLPSFDEFDAFFSVPSTLPSPITPTIGSMPSLSLSSTPVKSEPKTDLPITKTSLIDFDEFFSPSSKPPALKPPVVVTTPSLKASAVGSDAFPRSSAPSFSMPVPLKPNTTSVSSGKPSEDEWDSFFSDFPSAPLTSPVSVEPVTRVKSAPRKSAVKSLSPVRASVKSGVHSTSVSVVIAAPNSISALKIELAKILKNFSGTETRQYELLKLTSRMDPAILSNAIYDMGLQETLMTNGLKLK